MNDFRDKVTTILNDARASSSSEPEGSSPEGFGGVIRADAEVVAVLCRRYLEPEHHVTIDELVIRDLLDQIARLQSLSMHWIVWGRLDEAGAAIVKAKVFPGSAPGKGWISLGQLQLILRRGMAW